MRRYGFQLLEEFVFVATVDPTVHNDTLHAFGVGQFWINSTMGTCFQCVDATDGAAVWTPTASSNAGIVWSGPWSSSITYAQNDAVSYNGGSYIALQPNLNVVPTTGAPNWGTLASPGGGLVWQGAWSSITPYIVNAVVSFDGGSYVALQDNTDIPPSTGEPYWDTIAASGGGGITWLGAWNSSTNYVANDAVSYLESSYVALESSQNITPDTGEPYWDLLAAGGGLTEAEADTLYRSIDSYIWTQGVAATTWTINHNLGTYPAVVILDSTGTVIETTIQYVNANTLLSISSYAFSGEAILT
jgi:hypothetical protein